MLHSSQNYSYSCGYEIIEVQLFHVFDLYNMIYHICYCYHTLFLLSACFSGWWIFKNSSVIWLNFSSLSCNLTSEDPIHKILRGDPVVWACGTPCWRSQVQNPLPAQARGLPSGSSSSHWACLVWVTSPMWFASYCSGWGFFLSLKKIC